MHKGYFDGATVNSNPGKLGLGACIFDEEGNEIDAACCFREHGTNNESEYLSLILLMTRAKTLGIKDIDFFGDSKLIVNQVTGAFKASEKFKPYLDEIEKLKLHFERISFTWIKRELNKRADELSKLGTKKEDEYWARKKARKGSSSEASKVKEEQLALIGNANTKMVENDNEVAQVTQEAQPIENDNSEVPETKSELVKESQPKKQVQQVEEASPALPEFKVNSIGQGRLLIQRGHKSAVIDLVRRTCSCDSFRRDKRCSHIEAVEKILPIMGGKKTAKQASFSKSL